MPLYTLLEMRNVYTTLVGDIGGKSPFRRTLRKYEDNIKPDL